MIKYVVDLKVNADIYDEFLTWLANHIKEILCFNGFIKAEMHEEVDVGSIGKIHYLVISYDLDSLQNLQEYFDNYAITMRKQTAEKFGDKVKASRRIFSVKQVFSK